MYHEQTLLGGGGGVSNNNATQQQRAQTPEHERMDSVIDHSKSLVFDETFYVVVLEKHTGTGTGEALLHMWRLSIASQAPSTLPAHCTCLQFIHTHHL